MKNKNMKGFKNYITEIFAGERRIIGDNLSAIYSGNRLEEEVNRYRKNMMRKYIAILLICIILVVIFSVKAAFQHKVLTQINRPESGEGYITVPVEIQANYKNTVVDGNASVQISEKKLSNKEIEEAVSDCAKRLKNIVPESSDGKHIIFEDIELPENDEKSGASIIWTSDDPVLVSNSGKVNVLALSGESEELILTADISLEGIGKKVEIPVTVVKEAQMYESSIVNSIDEMLKEIDANGGEDTVKLPQKLDNGVNLKWNIRSDNKSAVMAIMGVVSMFGIYLSRYSTVRKKVRRYRESVVEDFPYIIDKLVLMLNSGLTVFSALLKISEDSAEHGEVSPLTTELSGIGIRVRETNASWLNEWKDFAVRMESGDMLRFISILEDNYKKGGELVGKLEAEGDNMREMRKKTIQQRIRMIDSKMTIPMMLMLIALVIVTVTPSVMQM